MSENHSSVWISQFVILIQILVSYAQWYMSYGVRAISLIIVVIVTIIVIIVVVIVIVVVTEATAAAAEPQSSR